MTVINRYLATVMLQQSFSNRAVKGLVRFVIVTGARDSEVDFVN